MDPVNIKDKKVLNDDVTDSVSNLYGHITDRVQKITGALYRVTDLLSDKEPLKWALRDRAVILYNNLTSIKFIKDKINVLDDTLSCLFQIIKSLELVSMGFYISNLNFEILKKEYIALKSFIEGKKLDLTAEKKLLSGFSPRKEIPKKDRGGAGTGIITADIIGVESETLSPDNRKERILEFMKTGEEKTMGEITLIFSDEISEKAVQRDLFYLVKSGKLIAKGDKRWRKYKLASLLPRENPIFLGAGTNKEAPEDINLTEKDI